MGKLTARREDFTSENGNTYKDRWVVRNAQGDFMDHGKYRNDLREKWELKGYTFEVIGD